MFNHIEIYKIRKALSLTQVELAAILGISSVSVHLIEKGDLRLSERFQVILRDELGIDRARADELIRQYNEKKSIAGAKARAMYKLKIQEGND